eukprot:snap_masked-scaffold_3-processed-gene-10.31-mRNA-1 protein AED:0.00 eAED:0.00 QI:40/1/1/1/1/1/2/1231/253
MQMKANTNSILKDKVAGAIYGALIGDALAFPTHWYYGGFRQIQGAFGDEGITGYTAPKEKLQGSIMSLSNTGGAGRGSFDGDIIGSVIFHGKKKYWQPGKNYFYHNLLKSGDNTLELLLMRRNLPLLAENNYCLDKSLEQKLLEDYAEFMQTPNSHNDTYCGTSHRMFFHNLSAGMPLTKCADNDNHNVDATDGLIMLIPFILSEVNERDIVNTMKTVINLFRKSEKILPSYALVFSDLLRGVCFDGKNRMWL